MYLRTNLLFIKKSWVRGPSRGRFFHSDLNFCSRWVLSSFPSFATLSRALSAPYFAALVLCFLLTPQITFLTCQPSLLPPTHRERISLSLPAPRSPSTASSSVLLVPR